jgi:hypothetical protein
MNSERHARELSLVRAPPGPSIPSSDTNVGDLPAPVTRPEPAPPIPSATCHALRMRAARLVWRNL